MRRLAAVTTGATLTLTMIGVSPASATAPVPTTIWLKLTPVPGLVGDEVRIEGALTRVNGTGLGGKSVRLAIGNPDGSERRYLATVTTGSNGAYSRTVRAPLNGHWQAVFEPEDGDDHAYAFSRTAWVPLRYRTRIVGYSAGPRVAALGSKITVKGRVHKLGVPSAFPLVGGRVELLWSGDGRTWRRHAHVATNRYGDFRFQPVINRDGYWTTRLPAAGDHIGTSTGVTFVDGRFRTRLSLNAAPEPLKRGRSLTISGKLLQVDAAGRTRVMGGRLVRIFVRSAGSNASRLLGTAKTNRYGVYTFKYRATKSASFRATWIGVGNHLTSSSGWDFVSVRP
ncbi:hypothetical protein [Thermomonospora umbrina]|uniref:Carboxypeptidase family protein n=1 Tax=Thermomonospora umbrina TaxID=111806 RepID=A0A3D9SP49_9ACTN|nr:hypothetical protein [Thermomonospora umbrina]REE97732.1 hypothetical protein DFJ69_3207 [Thermomonospora umbrina]